MANSPTNPSGSKQPTPSTKTRERKFPIRQFSKLLDEFLHADDMNETDAISDLKDAVDQALLKAYKS